MKIKYFTLLLLSIIFMSCSDDETTNDSQDNSLDGYEIAQEINNEVYTVEVYTETGDFVQGYNSIKLKVKNTVTETYEENVVLTWEPVMNMGDMDDSMDHGSQMRVENDMMMHSCPNSSITTESAEVSSGYIVFQMPTVDNGTWYLGLSLEIEGVNVVLSEMITVLPQDNMTSTVFSGYDGKRYVLALINPADLDQGTNDIQATLHEMEGMMSFPVVEDFKLELDPRMPDMGNHSSSDNEDLIYMSTDKIYEGKLNLTMTGRWVLNFVLVDGDENLIYGSDISETNEQSELYLEFSF